MIHRFVLLLGFSLAAPLGWAQSPPAENIRTPQSSPPFFSRVRGLFDIELPELDPPGTVKLILNPHLSDLVRRDYVRTDVGFRWALNDHFEFSTEAAAFVARGLRSNSNSNGYGIGELHYGLKYIFSAWPRADFETSLSLNITQPVGQPPFDLTDGHNHYTPSVVIQHHSDRNPHLTTFAGATVDLITPSGVAGAFQRNQPQDNSLSLTAGGVYDLGQLQWTFSGTYTTTAFIGGGPEHFFYVRPGVLWYVPKKMTFRSKTQWIIGLGTPMTWGPDGYELKVNSRLRAEITFGQVIDHLRHGGSQ